MRKLKIQTVRITSQIRNCFFLHLLISYSACVGVCVSRVEIRKRIFLYFRGFLMNIVQIKY